MKEGEIKRGEGEIEEGEVGREGEEERVGRKKRR